VMSKMPRSTWAIHILAGWLQLSATQAALLPQNSNPGKYDLAGLLKPLTAPVPHADPVPSLDKGEIKAFFYDGLAYQGHATRVFAYVGIPPGANSKSKVPGMVLVHGGGGTAFPEWVRIWNERGYAAIAMDLEGHAPVTN